MKIRIELDDNLTEDEVVFHCRGLTPEIMRLQQVLTETDKGSRSMILYKEDTEYFLPIEEILFFETEAGEVRAHTMKDAYLTHSKLYELETQLPGTFMRISKSAIVNCRKIYSIHRNLTASSLIEFQNTHKEIYVSRAYYKPLKEKIEEMRLRR